jgi:hypothetical protein
VTKVQTVEKGNTAVPYVESPHTAPSNATLLPELLIINTPFIPDQWEKMLNHISPFNKFSDVPIGIRFGFDMGVHSPPLQTYTPPNHNSALLYSRPCTVPYSNSSLFVAIPDLFRDLD